MQLSKNIFSKRLYSGEYTLIDVRTKKEQDIYGVISEDQIHVDISQTDAVSKILDLDKNKKYLIYCWHGVRSAQVNSYMKSIGFLEVYDLEGGIDEWNKN